MLELDGRALGKPGSVPAAAARWREMRGRTGTLHTGHCLIDTSTGRRAVRGVDTDVRFGDLTDDEIDAYCATGEPTDVAGAFTIDGRTIKAGANPSFVKTGTEWTIAGRTTPGLRKSHGLQGPVDDAFVDPFLCVRPTGTPWNAASQHWAAKTLDVFSANFAKWLRGDVRVKDDRAVAASDIADYNLILFGDPGSNSVIGKVIGQLPIRWSKTEITIGTHTFGAGDHIPAVIYPNPLNPKRYVVINSGHTFGDEDFRGTNAWLYPRLGDYSVLASNGDIAMSGFFDEQWRLR